MEDINDEDACEPMPERTRTRKRTRRTGSDVYEVTEEYTESTTVTQTFEDVEPVTTPSTARSTHQRMRSEPLSKNLIERARMARPPRSPIEAATEASERAAVDQLLDQEMTDTPTSDDAITVAVSRQESATSAGPEKVRLVLRTTSHKLLSRKRIVRRISTDEITTHESSSDRSEDRIDARSLPWTRGRGGLSPRKASASSAISNASAEPTMVRNSFSPIRRQGIPPSNPVGLDVERPFVRLPNIRNRSSPKTLSTSSRRPSTTVNPAPLVPSSSPVASSAILEDSDEEMLDLGNPAQPPPTPPGAAQGLDNEISLTVPMTPPNTVRGNSRPHRRLPSFSRVDSQSSLKFSSTLTEAPPSFGTDTPEALFPHDLLLKNIHRFMKFSSAAYGQNFLRIFGMGSSEFNFPTTGRHHANTWSFVSCRC